MNKLLKREQGITLIALVITIIILIILAAISVQAITGTGLFEKTRQAKNEYENSEKVENTRLQEYVNAINNEINGGESSQGTNQNTSKKGTKVTTANAKSLYGEAVDYHPSTDPDGVYRVFYYDENGDFGDKGTIYLKRDDDKSMLDLIYGNRNFTKTENALNMMKKMNKMWDNTENKNMTSNFYEQENFTMFLCDTTRWTNYLDANKANYAIGSPSIEMYVASYNDVQHPSLGENQKKVDFEYNTPSGVIHGYNVLNGKIDSSDYNNMYCGKDNTERNYSWWLASPAEGYNSHTIDVRDGKLKDGYFKGYYPPETGVTDNGICPVVSLKNGIDLTVE